ncbi:alpha/beta fold hydrolase [Chitinimonas koreensis]|uniref:alpha/beta fold hydrolase n=1 Tax=Chitinimonas koreensis TaxID=356302 RepID=UPI0003FDADD8|nr:alpha/beta hydrolase [Chitinimonas koreensis]QNM96935.1 alpha/beta hydrolase [Chitinimonas koreensis]
MAAPTWILLRGLGREARHWGGFPPLLAEALGGVRVLAPDLAGNGRRWRERSAATLAGQCDGLRAELAEVLAQGPVNLLAISLGGMVALDWATRRPTEVGRLVLVNTSLAGLAPFWRRLRWPRYPAIARLPLQSIAARERSILAMVSNDPARRAAALPQWIAWQREAPVARANLLRQLAAAARFRLPPQWPGCPALLLASRRDRLVDPACSQALAAAAGWPLRLHETAGHDLPLDDPHWLAAQVAQWCGAPSTILDTTPP